MRRAMSQKGVPYSWGGGYADGPSRGIDDGANTIGFDCSGLVLYAFAGVGIKLPHYSGSQYNAGRKVPSSQMRRGDLIFYGPNASQHEAMYLGDGMMLEAPYTGSPSTGQRRRGGLKAPMQRGARRGPQDPVVADAPGRRDLLRSRRQPARDALPR